MQLALEAHGICESFEARRDRQSKDQVAANRQDNDEDQVNEQPQATYKPPASERAAKLSEERLALYRQVRPSLAGELPLAVVRTITKLILRDHALPDDLLADLYPFDDSSDEGVRAYIDTADRGAVQQLLCDLILGDDLQVNQWNIEGAEVSDAHMALHAISVAMQLAPQASPHSQNSERLEHVTDQPTSRVILKLKAKEQSEEKQTDGPIIKVKKHRAALAPAAAWPFPTGSKQSM